MGRCTGLWDRGGWISPDQRDSPDLGEVVDPRTDSGVPEPVVLLAPLREDLRAAGLPTAREVSALRDGAQVHYAGVVICRQRPATAKEVTFMTLEDETGFVNLVLWARVYEEYRMLARTRSFLGVSGRIQSEDSVVHLIVERLWEPALRRQPVATGARDFH